MDVTKRATAIDLMRHRIFSNDKLPTEPLGHAKELMVTPHPLNPNPYPGADGAAEQARRVAALTHAHAHPHPQATCTLAMLAGISGASCTSAFSDAVAKIFRRL